MLLLNRPYRFRCRKKIAEEARRFAVPVNSARSFLNICLIFVEAKLKFDYVDLKYSVVF